MKRFVCSASNIQASSNSGHRVVQISLDIEVPAGVDPQSFIDELETRYATSDKYNIAGGDVVEDLTDIYERDYSNLLVFQYKSLI